MQWIGDLFGKKSLAKNVGEEEGGWRSSKVRDGYRFGLWKAIRKDWDLLGSKVTFSVGNGRRVRFWLDKCCGDEPLRSSFLSLFALTISKEVWMTNV